MSNINKFLKPTIILEKPMNCYDTKPEIWNIINTKINYLVYYPHIISTRLISHKPSDIGYKFETNNSIYICDWAPTIKEVEKEYFNNMRDKMLMYNSF
tara:strand:+ start:62 stop:355 length:294 start_codon:yes stop_codon:yes gene_type:complete